MDRIPREAQNRLLENVVSTFWLCFSVGVSGVSRWQAFHSLGETLTTEPWMVPLRDLLLAALQSRESSIRLLAAQSLAFVCLCSDRVFATDVLRQFEVPRFHNF